jgi:hypothetical protein
VPWAPLDATGERLIVIDVGGGEVDRLLWDADVATVLTDRFAVIFLHPRARPELTARLGWPSVTALDEDGCVRVSSLAPRDAGGLVDTLNTALRARRDHLHVPMPPRREVAEAPGGGVWTADDPWTGLPWIDPIRGVPAVLWNGVPYVYGNRADAATLAEAGDPTAAAFLARLPRGAPWAPSEGPVLGCPDTPPPSVP